jgi:His/Glu/Gln/Arg/opine family amino acid ABC transporter permease subunit
VHWSVVWEYRWPLLIGLWTTIQLSLLAMAFSLCLGTIAGVLRISQLRILRKMATGYIEVLRNVPLVVKLFFLYFGFDLSALVACLIGLTLHQSAYIADVVQSGVQSVGVGQVEGGQSVGLSWWQVASYIVLPQALRIALPALTNQFIEVIKNSSLAMTITIVELTFVTQTIQQETFRGFEAATVVTVLYAALGAAAVLTMRLIERRLSHAQE